MEVLSDRALNRALLARQGLLERRRAPALEEVERLVALQAQVPRDPYVALWTRLEGFDPPELSGALEAGEAVRTHALRPTIHLLSARDARALYPLNAPLLRRSWRSTFEARLNGADP